MSSLSVTHALRALLLCASLACSQVTAHESADEPAQVPAEAHDAPDEVHWTVLASDAVAFDWRGGGYAISFWLDGNPPGMKTPPRVQPASAHPGDHRTATLTGLAADSAYRYRIDGQPSGNEHAFRTPPTSCAAEFMFAAEGDIGASTRSPSAPAVQRLIAEAKPRFVLGLGDLAYANGSELLVHTHLDDVMVWSRDAAYVPAWGNHDWMYGVGDDLAMYKDRFTLPNDQASPGAPAAGCCEKDWSWFDYGCLRVITYPEPYRSESWRDWAVQVRPLFEAAQADARIRFVITAGHRPAYTSGGHHGEERIRRILDDLAESFDKYVMNLAGHNHGYERTESRHGVVHVTVGTGGAGLDRQPTSCGWARCPRPPWSRFRALHHGAVTVKVSANRIAGAFVCGPASREDDVACAAGDVADTFVIRPR